MSEKKSTSPRGQLNTSDAKNILKVFLWSMLSSAIGFGILLLPQIQVPEPYALIAATLIPMINTMLVAAKKLADDHGKLF
jgi:hypothetical protein